MTDADTLIAELALTPHPEGGHYRETIRHADPAGGRARMTAILFLLDVGERSHWHRVDAEELWLWHAGAPLTLSIADDSGIVRHRLGGDIAGGETPQALVPTGAWQAAEARDGWALVSCVVTPGFDFAGFELAPPGWEP